MAHQVAIRLPGAPERYDRHDQAVFRRDVELAIQDLAQAVREVAENGGGGGGGGWTMMADTGRWTIAGLTSVIGGPGTLSGMLEGTIFYVPFTPAQSVTVSEMQVEVLTALGSGNVQMGIYDNVANRLYPGDLLATTGNVSVAATGLKPGALTSALALEAGVIYWASVFRPADGLGGTNPNLRGQTSTSTKAPAGYANGTTYSATQDTGLTHNLSGSPTSLPSTAPAGATWQNGHIKMIGLRTQ